MSSDFKLTTNTVPSSNKYSSLLTSRAFHKDNAIAFTQSRQETYAHSLIKSSPFEFALAAYGVKAASELAQGAGLAKALSVDKVYNFIRAAEVYTPVFRIPLKASQIGDLLSPFVSDDTLRWNYSGNELLTPEGKWRKQFAKIGELVDSSLFHTGSSASGSFKVTTSQAKDLIQRNGLAFEKTGKIFGSLVTYGPDGKKVSLVDDIFLMERASSSTGGLSSLWETSRRPVTPFQALPEDSLLLKGMGKFYGNLSDEGKLNVRKSLGFLKNYSSDFFMEFFSGMNRFLKEPVPFLDKILGKTLDSTFTNEFSRDPLDRLFNATLSTDSLAKKEVISFGRLPKFMRPYVDSKYWKSTPAKLVTALAAKGALYVKGLPAAYFAADTLRRKFDFTGSSIISTPLFAGIGLAAGSLLETSIIRKGIFKKFPISKSQLAGGVIGAAIGGLSVFDKGIGAGAGAIYSKASMFGASFWTMTGGHEALKRQEDLFPGLTNPLTGVGFVMSGGILGHLGGEVGSAASYAKKFLGTNNEFYQSIEDDFAKVRSASKELAKDLSKGNIRAPEIEASRKKLQSLFDDLFSKYEEIEKPSRIDAISETRSILEGKHKGVPRSQAGLVAYSLVDQMDTLPELQRAYKQRVGSSAGQLGLAGQIVDSVSEISHIRTSSMLSSQIEKEGLSKGASFLKRTKNLLTSKTPSAARGAARGALAFMGVSVLGALVAGPGGGNFNPVNLIPGWMIRLTGGGRSAYEAKQVFSGEKEVAIRKARWWSLGSTPFEGHKIEYFRKHRAVLMQSDAKVNALYGSRDEMEKSSALLHPIRALIDPTFLYRDDIRMSRISPTPLTAGLLKDIPILGDVLSSTIGEVIKPTRKIRQDEWEIGGRVIAPPGHFDTNQRMGNTGVALPLGGKRHYEAERPAGIAYTFKGTFERFSEQSGLRGFLWKTGLEELGYKSRSYKPVIERGNSLFSVKDSFWSLNIGDPFGFSEGLRRYIGKDNETYYNPLKNMAPSWLPSKNYTTDFSHGNYFRKVKEGYHRLPGAGYETLNPELRGLHPENYSLGHKYKILSDVAYQSDEWKFVRNQVIQKLQAGSLSQRDTELVAQANEQIDQKTTKRSFRKYQFDKPKLAHKQLTISAVFADGSFSAVEFGRRKLTLGGVNISEAAIMRQVMERENVTKVEVAKEIARERKIKLQREMARKLKVGAKIQAYVKPTAVGQYKDIDTKVYIPDLIKSFERQGGELVDKERTANIRYNKIQKMFGKAWETYTHNADLPLTPALAINKILPFQPQAKFIKRLDPIELYAQTQVYGKDVQMWQRYKQDFIDVAINDVSSKLLGDFVPKKKQFQRTLLEYFDKVKWYKNFTLEQAAKRAGNKQLAREYGARKRQTIFGANPYDGFSDIWRALPSSEKDFYRDFLRAESDSDRSKILSLVPSYMQKIYIGQWQNREIRALENKVETGRASDYERTSIQRLRNLKKVEGMNWTEELQREYESETRGTDTTYADWMRSKQLERYFQSFKLPDKNWVGFNPMVDLEDVKLQVAKQEGIDIHDIGLWGRQEAMIDSKPYVIEAGQDISDWKTARTQVDFRTELRRRIQMPMGSVSVMPYHGNTGDKIIMKSEDTRVHEIKRLYSGYGTI